MKMFKLKVYPATRYIGALLITGIVAVGARGAVVPVTNSGFESNDLTGWTPVVGGGWNSQVNVIDTVADQANAFPEFGLTLPGPGAPDGTHYARVVGHGDPVHAGSGWPSVPSYLYQDVGALLPDTTYTLTVAIGSSTHFDDAAVGTLALVNGTNQSGTVLSSISTTTLGSNSQQYSGGEFEDLTVTFTTGPSVSGDLTILITSLWGYAEPTFDVANYHGVFVDNVRLDATVVPEPVAVSALALGGLMTLARRRRA